ncbi:phosphomannomutase [Phaeovulum sp. W22_SRMD_FR3]|uniref:phosphomannomutase n=1 Tax=Phaeovulum sp. W22_SRMD_FR3 TaxID=3240274 RepID=UPI003F989190
MSVATPKFGTSGLRGLVTALTTECITQYTHAFLAACPVRTGLFVGRDLRDSSGRIAGDVIAAARAAGVDVTDCGEVPTPALALASMRAGAAAIMVTGSHIPADRNGLKFYLPSGEISKSDETAIVGHLGTAVSAAAEGALTQYPEAASDYVGRYVSAFGTDLFAGLRLGIYQHSSVARDLLCDVVTGLGGDAVPLARSEVFVPVDTEAVDPDTRTQLAAWCAEYGLDAVLSTDGDADRPMLVDATGTLVAGDLLGVLTAQALGAEVICTPVSSNSMVTELGFRAVELTRIGSPFVIAAMEGCLAQAPDAKVVGFEANGGFLLGFDAQGPAGALPALMTRDAFLPMVAPLAFARARGCGLAEMRGGLPARVTAADRLTDIPTEASNAFLDALIHSPEKRAAFVATMGEEVAVDLTDGLRIYLDGKRVVHLRPSGNAPEFRVYAEADSTENARILLASALSLVVSGLA